MMDKINKAEIDGKGNVVIQDVDNSTITINLNNSDEVRKFIIDFQSKLSELPVQILNALKDNIKIEQEIKIGANMYLTVVAGIHEFGPANEVLFGVTITNLTKDVRYFNQPYFKVEPPFQLEKGLEHDTFMLMHREKIQFPYRLEYGQVLSLSFPVNPKSIPMYEKIDGDKSFIQSFTSTTVGEMYSSNQYSINKFIKDFKAVMALRAQ